MIFHFSLGADHDTQSGEGENCTSEFTMNPTLESQWRTPKTVLHFSNCSKSMIKKTAQIRAQSPCLNFLEKPVENKRNIPLPGETLTRRNQCNRKGRHHHCANDTCLLKCRCGKYNPKKKTCKNKQHCLGSGYALDGTPCSNPQTDFVKYLSVANALIITLCLLTMDFCCCSTASTESACQNFNCYSSTAFFNLFGII